MLNVLLIEDSPADVYLFEEYLQDSTDETYHVINVNSLEKAWYLKQVLSPHVVVVDLSLPVSTGEETLILATRYFKDLPIIVLTGLEDVGLAKKAVGLGFQNFLVKKEINADLLNRSIQCAIERHQLAQQDKLQQRSLLLQNEQLKWAMNHRY